MTARAMVLAAGYGTRLRPLTDEVPKPLVPIGDRPLVAHIAGRLSRAGFDELVMNVHHHAEAFRNQLSEFEAAVHLVHEVEIRGTAGGVAGARSLFGAPPIVVWNGDVLAEPPLAELALGAEDGGLCFAVAPRDPGAGTVGLGADGRIVRLRGEVFGVEAGGGDYIGVAALGGDVLRALPDRGCLVGDVALPLLRRGEGVRTVPSPSPWTDVGTLASYHAANLEWLRKGQGVAIHPTARIAARVEVVDSVVGSGAAVEGNGRLERCVVWPGARALAPLKDAVVTTLGRVVSVS